jgi:hypothetical protein
MTQRHRPRGTAAPIFEPTPDPYASIRPIELTPDLDPNYDRATGVPADGYAIALAYEQLKEELKKERR